MKKLVKIILATLCAAVLTVPVFLAACEQKNEGTVDYVSQVQLDFSSTTKKQEVTVRLYVDGDTTHFDPVANSSLPGCNNASDFSTDTAPTKGYAKARYLAINTPESTGQIEPWGKAASKFTRSKLENATSIVIESNDDQWNIDSTGGRYLLWVWYKPKGESAYRNLNVEILQEGLAFASGISESRYAKHAQAAIDQAQEQKLYVFSDDKDPDYYYGGPINVTLKELRFNTETYAGKKIVVEGTVVADFNNSVYIEETYYDIEGYEQEGIRIGMPVYYSYTKGKVLEILSVGNRVNVVGVVQLYETGGYYQITDIKTYDRYNPDNPDNCKLIETVGLDKAYTEIKPADFASQKESVSVEVNKKDEAGEDYPEVVKLTYAEALMGTSVSVSNLTVTHVSTTKNEDSANYGAMTLTCKAEDGSTITIRTGVFKDEDGNLITASTYLNKKISVKGVIEYYDSQYSDIPYQIKSYRQDYITIVG